MRKKNKTKKKLYLCMHDIEIVVSLSTKDEFTKDEIIELKKDSIWVIEKKITERDQLSDTYILKDALETAITAWVKEEVFNLCFKEV